MTTGQVTDGQMTLAEQYEKLDSMRTTSGVNYDAALDAGRTLIDYRQQHPNASTVQLQQYGRTTFAQFAQQFPMLFDAVTSEVEFERLDEFRNVFIKMVATIKQVQQGKKTQQQCSKELFQEDLDQRYFTPANKVKSKNTDTKRK